MTTVGAVVLAVSFILAVISQPIRFVDDAWISFRYADNLAFRGELTFNQGERVEGVSNLLWTLILAAERRLLPAPIESLAAATALALTALWLYRLWKLGRELGVGPVLAAAAAAMVILTPSGRETMLNGLEGPLFALLLAEASLRLLRGQIVSAAVCLGLLFLTRVEGGVIGAAALLLLLRPSVRLQDGLALSVHLFDLKSPERRAEVGRAFAVFLGLVVAATAFRVAYYRDLLPNSVQAKLYPYSDNLVRTGWQYALDFLRANPHLLVPPLMATAALFLRKSAAGRGAEDPTVPPNEPWGLVLRFNLIALIFSFIVAIRSGGDWMGGFRFLSIYAGTYAALLLLALSVLLGTDASPQFTMGPAGQRPLRDAELDRASWWGLAVCALLLAFPLWQTVQQSVRRLAEGAPVIQVARTPGFRFWDDVAARLEEAPLQDTDVVSSEGIGYLSYVLKDVYIHDPLGLTEEHIAKQGKERSPFGKVDLRYTIREVRPTLMIWHYAGNLRGFQAADLDGAYFTFCHGDCKSWSADVVMIRRDRADDLAPYFRDWTPLTFEALYAENS